MRKGVKIFYWFCLMLVLTAGLVWAQQSTQFGPNSYVQNFDKGKIDWKNGVVTAVGIGAPPANAVNMAQARAMARRAAIVVARRNLLETIQGVQIDSKTTVDNYMVTNDVVVNQVRGFLQNSQILDTAYMSDGSVEVTVGMNMRGGLSDIIMPQDMPFNPSPEVDTMPDPMESPQPLMTQGAYTGLIIDAKGLGARPAMSPKILDENGMELYGSAMVSREYAIQQGMAGYAKDSQRAATNPRVANNPLIVKASKVEGKAKTNLVLGNEQANMVRSAAENQSFLEKCRVMIVLD